MAGRKYLSGKLTPIDINSEEFKKCKKIRKRGYTIHTNYKELANISPKELAKMSKGGRAISVDIDLSRCL